ncbi:MAG: PQQ-like beta-propeller repeat protein [Akkermansiaceae bacterium]|nr:PQQ-like beta-propeller repeat protein [Akkermansiaceae bacterium]NNM27907.1 PQQ-like beta-propeller repeat protein [Akkermansiaceae bacterium]
MKTFPLLVLAALAPPVLDADDWPQWFGPGRDGIWREAGIVEKFPEGGPKVLWRTPIHRGYAGPAVADGRVYVIDREVSDPSKAPANPFKTGKVPGNERLLCLDAATGKVVWEQAYDCTYGISYAAGPRATPTVDGDRVYTLGAEGNLFCRSAGDGAEIWSHDFNELCGVETQVWGFAASPLVEGGLLICLAAGDGSTAMAFDKRTGKEVWRALSARDPGYCPPRIIEHAGRRLLIVWHPESVNALDPATGESVWTIPWKIRSGLTIPTPQPVGDEHLFLSSFYNGSMMLKLQPDHTTPEVVYRTGHASEKKTTHLHGIMNTAVLHDGHLYAACSYGEFRCMEAATGKRLWESLEPIGLERPTRWGTVFVTPHEDRFFLFTERGDLVIARLSAKGYVEVDRAHVIAPDGIDLRQREIVWSHPAYARKCCFVRNDSEVICLSLEP